VPSIGHWDLFISAEYSRRRSRITRASQATAGGLELPPADDLQITCRQGPERYRTPQAAEKLIFSQAAQKGPDARRRAMRGARRTWSVRRSAARARQRRRWAFFSSLLSLRPSSDMIPPCRDARGESAPAANPDPPRHLSDASQRRTQGAKAGLPVVRRRHGWGTEPIWPDRCCALSKVSRGPIPWIGTESG
jgi:hypothetical protein